MRGKLKTPFYYCSILRYDIRMCFESNGIGCFFTNKQSFTDSSCSMCKVFVVHLTRIRFIYQARKHYKHLKTFNKLILYIFIRIIFDTYVYLGWFIIHLNTENTKTGSQSKKYLLLITFKYLPNSLIMSVFNIHVCNK